MARRNILAQLVVAVREQGAKATADAVKGVSQAAADAAKHMNSVKAGQASREFDKMKFSAREMARVLADGDWTQKFSQNLQKLKVAPREFDEIRRSWIRLQDALNTPGVGRSAAAVLPIEAAWRRRQLVDLAVRRAELQRIREEAHGPLGLMKAGGRALVGAAGVYGAGHAAQSGIRASALAAGTSQREEARDFLGGLTEADTARLKGASVATSGRYQSIDAATVHNLLRETALSTGAIDKAVQLAEPLSQAMTTLQSLKGRDAALAQLTGFVRALDTLGKNVDPKQMAGLLDGAVRAAGVMGAEYNPADVWTTAKTAKSAGFSLSDEFLNQVLPSLIADMGASRPGTALGSATAQLIGGRATDEAKAYQKQLGLRNDDDEFPTRDLFAANPFRWANDVLIPALAKGGVDTKNNAAVVEAASKLFSNQTVADVLGRMVTQREQIEKTMAALAKAPGLAAAETLSDKDPFVAAAGAMAQLRNAAAALAEPALPAATAAMNSFAGSMAGLTKALRDDPQMAKNANTVAASAVAGAGLVGSIRAAAALWQGGGVAGAIGQGLRGSLRGALLGGVSGGALTLLPWVGNFLSALTPRDAQGNALPEGQRRVYGSALPGFAGDYDRSMQAQRDRIRDPEAARGRAMMELSNSVDTGQATAAGQAAGAALGSAMAVGVQGQVPAVVAAGQTVMDALRALVSGGVTIPIEATPGASAVSGSPAGDGTAPARASGGSVSAGSVYRVNEHGEELFQPMEDGRIIDPRRKAASDGSAGRAGPISMTTNLNVSGSGDPARVAQEVMAQLETEFRAMLRGAFSDYGVETA